MLPVAVELPGDLASAGEWLADVQAMEAAGAHALLLGPGAGERQTLLGAVAALTWRSKIVAPDASAEVELLARGRLVREVGGTWDRVPVPENRAHWRELLAAAEARGAEAVVVPLNPRLLDLLRNEDVEEDRSDLQLAQG